MRIEEQFSRYAKSYLKYSIVQENGAKILINALPKNLGNVVDLGCGNGRLYKHLSKNSIYFDRFYGVDFSKEMLKMHPKASNIELLVGDFNKNNIFEKLKRLNINYIFSASALQWAKDLDFTLSGCSKVAPFGAFFIFSSGTFKSLHNFVNVTSPIHSKDEIKKSFEKYYKAFKIEDYNFKLKFNSNLEMLRYIKKSGVSGGKMQLSYKEIKNLIDNYPLNYLEFETVLLIGESK